jgi:acyl-CoA synthetase (AMP-forming)/AMP-acid ligase II
MGIASGDHVALCAPNSGDWLAFYFGVIKIGAVAVTLSSQLKADELTLLVNLFIVDRLKDMIISGGENVYSTEVEEVLYAFPDIQECAVIGMPDKEWGERVTAFILPKPGQTIDQRALKDFLKARLSAYKVPKRFFMVDDFPRSPAGKLLKRKLRQSFLKGDDSA